MRTDRFRRLEREAFDVVVVGAGIGGLTAAALLAKRGRSVLVIDRHYVPGGNASIFRRPGYEFDVGVHYIGQCGAGQLLPRTLSAAGADVRFLPLDPDGFDTLMFPGLELRVPRGLDRYRDVLAGAFPSERRGIDRYTKLLGEVGRLLGAGPDPRRLAPLLPRSLMTLRWANATLAAFLDTCTKSQELRAVIAAESGDYAQPPSRASLPLHAALMAHFLDSGAYYPEGGGQVMSDRLAESIERSGGKVLLSTRALEIVVENGRATGVVIENKHIGRRTVRAPVVISNADIKKTLLELLPAAAVKARTRRRAEKWEMSPALGMLYVGMQKAALGARTANTNYWLSADYDSERPYADARAGRFSERPFLFVSIASLKDPLNGKIAPPGIVNLQLMSLAPSGAEAWGVTEHEAASGAYSESPAYEERKADYTERLLRQAEQVFPSIREHMVFSELATPLTHARYTLATGGTSYGLAVVPEQFLLKRPGPKTEIEGLYLCGASMRTAHGISGSMQSGVMAAAAVHGRDVLEACGLIRGQTTRVPPAITARTGLSPNA